MAINTGSVQTNHGQVYWEVTPNENSNLSPEEHQDMMDQIHQSGILGQILHETMADKDDEVRQRHEQEIIENTGQTYEWSVEGIKSLPPDKLNELIGMITFDKTTLDNLPASASEEERREIEENTRHSKAYKQLITIKFRSGGFDVEKNWEIIETILSEYQKIMEVHIRAKADEIKATLSDRGDEMNAFDHIMKYGLPMENFRRSFFEVMIGDWKNRQLYVKWFHNKMAQDDMTAPVEVFNTQYGRGLRATRDIKKGDLVCYYPMDWVSDSALAPTDQHTGEKMSDEQCKWICQHNAGILGYGNPNTKGIAQVIMDKLRENLGRITRDLNDYGFSFGMDGGQVHIWGDPDAENHKTNNWFLGHMINDGGYHPDQTREKYNEGQRDLQEETQGVPTPSQECNVLLDTRMRASRDIKKGEEIKTYYGAEYWFGGRTDKKKTSERQSEMEVGQEAYKEECSTCRHQYNNLTKNQKKKEKKRIKEAEESQRRTFTKFRTITAQRTTEQHNMECLPSQICLTNAIKNENGQLGLESCIIANEGWIDGHPTQFSNFYPEFRPS